MENNLFLSLRKYRPREGNDPLENYVTAAFGWILKYHEDYSTFISSELCVKLNYQCEVKNASWSTQVHFSGFYPYMVCEFGNRCAFVFENKVWSPLHLNQLDNYRNHAKQHYDNYRLILITANKAQHSQNPDLAICWKDVYKWTEEWLANQMVVIDVHNIFRDFIGLLEYLGLGYYPPVSRRLDKNLLLGIMAQRPDALIELNSLAEQGLICKTETKKQDSDKWEVFYRLRDFYFGSEIGLRGIWEDIPRPCLRWRNAVRKDEYLNLDKFTFLNQNLAMLEHI